MKYEITEKKAAQMLDVSPGRVSQLVKATLLDSVTINGKVRICEESVIRYKQESRKPGRPPRTSYATATKHVLMNGPYEVADVVYDSALDRPLSVLRVVDASRAPFGVLTAGGNPKPRELNDWWLHRSIPKSRPGLDSKLRGLGIDSTSNLAASSMGLSLSDCYWLRPDTAPSLAWGDVNFFDNGFAEAEVDGWDSWLAGVGLSSPDNTSEGELPKKWVIGSGGERLLLKGCRSDDQRSFNEVVASALCRRLLDLKDYVCYEAVSTAEGPACCCENFLSSREEYVPAVRIKDLGGRLRASSGYDRLCRTAAALGACELEVREALSKMIVCDAVLANGDRHWRNFGFVRNIDTLSLRPAPLFDMGNSLWFAKSDAEVARKDWACRLQPFGPSAEEALACVDALDWLDVGKLDGFADEACDILSASRHASQPGRLDFIHKGIERNVELVRSVCRTLSTRMARGR